MRLLDQFDLRPPMRLVGAAAFDLTDADEPVQRELFDDGVEDRRRRLDKTLDLYLRALEHGPAGSLFNAGTEDEVTMRDVASAIARMLDLEGPVTAWPVEQARGALGPLADGLTTNKRMSSARARTALGWRPHRPGLIEEIERGSYRAAFAATHG